MAEPQLRVHWEAGDPQPALRPATHVNNSTVTVRVGELLPLLAAAYTARNTWLNDFADEEVIVSQDLYEVALAYGRYSQPSA